MNYFDSINGFHRDSSIEPETEPSDAMESELMTEAVYPIDIKPLLVRNIRLNLPKGEPNGHGSMVLLFTPNFDASVKTVMDKENAVAGPYYRHYYYMMRYRGTIYNKRYNIRNLDVRKRYYKEIQRRTNLRPFVAEKIPPKETRNLFFDLHTYLNIFQKYAARMPIPRKIASFWEYLKPVFLKMLPQYKKMALIPLTYYGNIGTKLKENINHPLYLLYYTLYKYPDLLKEFDLDFLFVYHKATLRINPAHLDPKHDVNKLRVQMQRLFGTIPTEALDEKETELQSIATEVEATTRNKLGLTDPVPEETSKDSSDETIEDIQKQKVETDIEKSVEKAVLRSTGNILKSAGITGEDISQQSAKVKAVVQMQVDNEINEDRRLLTEAYHKLKEEKVSKSARSTMRDELLRKQQEEIKIKGLTVNELSKIKAKEVPVKTKSVRKVVETPNENMTEMTFFERNKTYLEKVMPVDMMNAIFSLNDKSIPIYVRDIKIEDTSDELNYKETYTISLEDTNRQRHTIKVDIPKIVDGRFLYLGGGKKNIKNQEYFLPVVKIAEDEVQLVSNYNKMTVRRQDTKSVSYIERLSRLIKQEPKMNEYFRFGNAHGANLTGDFVTTVEYDELAKVFKSFTCGDLDLEFNQSILRIHMEEKKVELQDGKFCIGFQKNKPIFVDLTGEQKTEDGKSITDLIVEALPEDLQSAYRRIRAPKRLMYVNVKIMKQFIPVAMLLGFWEGLETVLRKCKAVYHLEDKMPRELSPSENVIRFADTFLVYEDSMETGLLLNGLRMFNTEKWNITDFDGKEPYMEYFTKQYGKGSIANALMNFYEWFIDPITKEILTDMDLPTAIVDLMIYAVKLLADSQHTSQLNQNIARVRSFEIIPMILYGELARQYVSYRSANGKKKFNIRRDSVINGILGVNTVEEISTLNPTLEMETTHGVSFKGFHGVNLDDSYTIAARSYDKSMTGVVSMSSPPDAGVGLNRMLTLEPNLTNVRGYAKVADTEQDLKKLKDTNLFGPGELTMPGAAVNDDPTRLGHAIKQSKHVIPVNDSDPVLVSNGMEEVTRFEVSSDFVVNADEDGTVVEIDEKLNLMVVEYKSGKHRAINMGTHIVKNSGGGFFLNNQLVTDLKVGDTFKKDAVLAYHKNFFTNSKYNNCRMNLGTLTRVAIMSSYNTYEDATLVTEDLSRRCGTRITECKQAVIGKNSNVLYLAKEGQEINVGDTLVAFDTSYDDSDLNALLDSLGDNEDMKDLVREGSRNLIRSKFSGKIISIKMYSTVDLDDLSPSLQKIFKNYYKTIKDRKALLEKYDEEGKNSIMKCGMLFTETTKKIEPNRYGTIRGQNVEDSVLIEFYIEELEPLEVGSKIANYSGLKNTIGEIIPQGYEPYSEWKPEDKIGTIIAENSILKRMTPSILEVGFANKLVVGLKELLKEIYEE